MPFLEPSWELGFPPNPTPSNEHNRNPTDLSYQPTDSGLQFRGAISVDYEGGLCVVLITYVGTGWEIDVESSQGIREHVKKY